MKSSFQLSHHSLLLLLLSSLYTHETDGFQQLLVVPSVRTPLPHPNAFPVSIGSPLQTRDSTCCMALMDSALSMTNDNDNNNNETNDDGDETAKIESEKEEKEVESKAVDLALEKKLKGRKNRVVIGYNMVIASYIALASFIFSKGGLTKFPLFFALGNLSLPAGVAYILIGAAKNDRLSSDTYKRLNLALLQYGVLGITTISIASEKRTNPLSYLPFLLTTVNAIKGFTYGALGWEKKSDGTTLGKECIHTIQKTFQATLSMPKNVKSFGYMAAVLLVGGFKLSKLYELGMALNTMGGGVSSSMITPLLSKINRISFLTAVLVTLKDASDRNRLTGTTFLQLNWMASLVLAANGVFMGGITTPMGGVASALSVFVAGNALASYFERNKL